MTLQPGTRLGPYEIVSALGAGGMGEVYRARDPRLGRDVAVKVLPRAASDRRRAPALASRRRRAPIAALSHPNLLAIFDVGTGDVPYLVTELVDGETLRSRIERGPHRPGRDRAAGPADCGRARRRPRARRRASRPEARQHHRHARRRARRSSTSAWPRTRSGVLTAATARHAARTLPGLVLGTLGYLAPEQARAPPGRPPHRHLRVRRRALRDADRPARVPRRLAGRHDRPDPAPSALGAGLRARRGAGHGRGRAPVPRTGSRRGASSRRTTWRWRSRPSRTTARGPGDRRQSGADARLPSCRSSTSAPRPTISTSATASPKIWSTRSRGCPVCAWRRVPRRSGFAAATSTCGRPDANLASGRCSRAACGAPGARLRLTVHLTSVDDGYHIWSERFDRELADVFEVQDEVVKAIVAAIAPALAGGGAALCGAPPANPEAYELYLKGRHLWNQRSPAVVGAAIALLRGSHRARRRVCRGLRGPGRLLLHPARLRLDARRRRPSRGRATR